MITFKQQFTFPDESVKGFAEYLGWREQLSRQIEVTDVEATEENAALTHFENEEYDNPVGFAEYVEHKAIEHTLMFTKSWAVQLKNDIINAQVEEMKAIVEPQLHTSIIKGVEDALTSEIVFTTEE